jgi:cytochrome b involved in lipid metabolism
MKNKLIFFIIFIIILTLTATAGIFLVKRTEKNTASKEEKTRAEVNQPIEIKKYSMEEIAKHNKKEDCWLLINKKVYDVSAFIAAGKHPPAILMGCGKDATRLFETRTSETGEKIGSGKPHSENARKLLEQYYIGELE